MAKPDSDRNLLVGVVALQLSLVSERQLISAMQAWAFEKNKPLEDLFLEQQAIDEQARLMLRELVDRSQLDTLATDSSKAEDANTSDIDDSLKTVLDSAPKSAERNNAENYSDFQLGSQAGGDIDGDGETQAYEPIHFGQRYRILRRLADGGLGRVMVAEDLELHRQVAVKHILPQYLNNRDNRERFMVEAEITGRLEHPGIVPVYSLGETAQTGPYYAMQLIPGVTLASAIDEVHQKLLRLDAHDKRLELRKLIVRLVDACQAVQYAHSKRVLHRDLKPKNIMLGKFGETFVVDWGLARVGKGDPNHPNPETDESILLPSGSGSTETRLGTTIGTVDYMSPEQADGRLDELSPASDVFSLGATLYCILTGTHPTSDPNNKTRRRLDYGHFLKPSQINSAVPPALDAICMKALQVEIDQRYPTAAALIEDLEAWLADEPVAAYPEPLSDRARRWLKEHKTLTAGIAGVLVTGVILLTLGIIQARIQNRELKIARDNAIANHRLSRKVLISELQLDDELLSKNELTAQEIVVLRQRLAQGVFSTYEDWYSADPADRELRNEFAFMARVMSNLKRSTSDFLTADVYIQMSLTALEKTPLIEMSLAEKNDYLLALIASSELDLLKGVLGRALLSVDKALKVLDSLKSEPLAQQRYAEWLLRVQANRAMILFELGRITESHDELKNSLTAIEARLIQTPDDAQLPKLRLKLMTIQAQTLVEKESLEAGIALADKVIAMSRQTNLKPDRDLQYTLLASLNLAAQLRLTDGQKLERVAELLKEAERQISSGSVNVNSATFREAHSTSQRLLGILHRQQNRLDESLAALEQSHAAAVQLNALLPLPQYLLLEARAAYEQSKTHQAMGNTMQANQSLNAARTAVRRAEQLSPESASIKGLMKDIEAGVR